MSVLKIEDKDLEKFYQANTKFDILNADLRGGVECWKWDNQTDD